MGRRVLVLGGTGWLGAEVVRAALTRGDDVVCLARGEGRDVPGGARLVRADRRAPGAYDAVAQADWDDVVEISSDLALVTPALDALAARAAHWTLVSTVSVYARHDVPGADESAEVVVPCDLTQYPDAKVAAERATAARVPADRLLVARPGLIVGPGDPSDRFGYWPARLQRGGRAGHTDRLHTQLQRLRGEQLHVAATRAEGDHPEAVRVALDDVDGLGADRAGRTEQHEVSGSGHRTIVPQRLTPVRPGVPGDMIDSTSPR